MCVSMFVYKRACLFVRVCVCVCACVRACAYALVCVEVNLRYTEVMGGGDETFTMNHSDHPSGGTRVGCRKHSTVRLKNTHYRWLPREA